MKGCERQNVAKPFAVDMLSEIPAKALCGIQLVGFAEPYIQLIRQMMNHRTERNQISSALLSMNH